MKVDFIYFDAGGGHRAAANALRQVMEQQGRPFEIRMVNLQEVLDAMDVFRKVTGLRLQDIYNLMLKKGWTLGSPQLMVGMHWVIRLFHAKTVRLLEEFWREHRPEMVVSLVPNFDRALCESLARALPGVPFVTILTDIADYPPHFWIERQVQHFICGSAKAVEQARAMGHAEDKVHRVSGMILNPRFYEIAPLSDEERAAARAKLGFDPAKPVGLVLFGGEGSAVMREIARVVAGPPVAADLREQRKAARKAAGDAARARRCSSKASPKRCRATCSLPITSSASRGRAASARRWRCGCR